MKTDCARRAQTSAKASSFNRKWSGIRIRIFGLIRIRISVFMAGSLPKCSGFTPCRRQSFCWIPWKAAGDCLRNANKCLKTSHSAMVREVEKWSGIRIRARITTKSQSILPIGLPHHNTKFQCNWLISFAVDLIPLTDTQIHKHD